MRNWQASGDVCETCGENFIRKPGEEWKRQCFPCFMEANQNRYRGRRVAPPAGERVRLLEDAVRMLQSTNAGLERQLVELQAYATRLKVELGRLPRGSQASAASGFTPDELNDLLRLVHPDKHGGSAKAAALTRKVLELRGRTPR